MASLRIVEQDGEILRLEVRLSHVRLEVISGIRLAGTTVILYDLHVDGPGPQLLGIAGLRQIIRMVMETHNVTELEIHGFRRTTGASPGRTPPILRFKRR